MKVLTCLLSLAVIADYVHATIWQNDQTRITDYPVTVINPSQYELQTYAPNATELSYKGRWDSKYISCAPGLKFGFTGEYVAITFGPYTTNATLIGYRIDGQDWQFTNVTANATHLLVSPSTAGINVTTPITPSTFELRVTNWAYGIQIASVSVSKGQRIIRIPNFDRTIEVIGDSLSAGQYATLEGLASYAYGLGAGLGNTEYTITAYPGICLFDKRCYGNLRGMFYQWYYASDVSGRAIDIYGDNPELWDFSKQPAADIVLINLGTNDANSVNNVTTSGYVSQYTKLIEGVHTVYPNAQIILLSLWEGFGAVGNTYEQAKAFVPEIYGIYEYFNSKEYLDQPVLYDHATNSTYISEHPTKPFVSYFNTTGLMQHNDIGPQYHPTDVGHVKVASHLIQYIKIKFGWILYATGPEVQHDTLYWNDMANY
ncbi:hypothetical protein BP5796_01903 [Coleophoma crateriformis]|uniref:Uncharacterized protein n=1 Tax=Coleophoma crateriformis TaxID=565419 RepID=A0A3D8T1Y3_9HELO|nr:hypothetical protein BP5796_01903 [Coleophoma crateriformis]